VKPARTEGALLAGVCAGIARTFSWNVWALRALFVVFLLIKTLWAIAVYAALAVALYLLDQARAGRTKSRSSLRSPELAGRSRRIEELEKRFEDLERRG
jgi:phage shock protein PspC (stress-responsive transcriptional regulator)